MNNDINLEELETKEFVEVEMPIKWADRFFPRPDLTHRGRMRFPFTKERFKYFNDIFLERQEISFYDYKNMRWLDMKISNISTCLNTITLDLKEEY